MSYPPHITFAIYNDIPLHALFAGLSSAAQQLVQTTVTFDSLSYFETTGGFVVFAVPSLSDRVLAAHKSIHGQIDHKLCHEHYQPENWVPHCSVATSISTDKKAEVLELIAQTIEPIDVIFDTIDCVNFMPVKVLREIALAP